MGDRSKESVDAAKHMPAYDAERINRAVEKAVRDPDLIDYAVGQLGDLQFPAFKHKIIDHARSINADHDVVALFESLDGYMEFCDHYHLQKALE